jgi:hypothetical protein
MIRAALVLSDEVLEECAEARSNGHLLLAAH